MRIRNFLIAALVLVLAVPALASAQGRDADKVTGGGQIIANSDARGPGDTVGFVATSDGGRISGEFQIVRTSTAGGSQVTMFHGRVTCLEVSNNQATFGGVRRDGAAESGTFFTVEVTDNGPENGTGMQGNDTIVVQEDTDAPCDNQGADQLRLARGNLTVHDADE